jgi:hypothetical protein
MGSALGAAPALGVNQTTVVRRVVQMEDSLGGIVFERRQSGPQITSLGERIATAEEHSRPEKAEALMVVGMEGGLDNLPPPRWLARMTPNSTAAARSNSLSNLASVLKAGLGCRC